MRRLALLIAVVSCVTATACSTAVEGVAVAPPGASRPTTEREQVQEPPPPDPTQQVEVGTWGQKFTWGNGITVEVPPPAPCKPGPYSHPQNAPRAVLLTVKITNESGEPFDTTSLAYGSDVQFANAKADTLFDSSGACKSAMGQAATVLPGKSYTHTAAYVVGPQPGEMQVTLRPAYNAAKAVFVGQA